jgi:hypothetical protein
MCSSIIQRGTAWQWGGPLPGMSPEPDLYLYKKRFSDVRYTGAVRAIRVSIL